MGDHAPTLSGPVSRVWVTGWAGQLAPTLGRAEGGVRSIEKWLFLKRKPLELVVLQGGGRGARHSLTAPHVVLGRLDPYETATFGNLLFPEPTVSRVHATLDWDEAANRYLLTHRSATNPTIINRVKVSKPRHVSPGDKIQMGNLILEIRVGIGQHAEIELETVDFTALTKQAANQVYRPETVIPEPPAVPSAAPQPPQEAPIPRPIPPPPRRQLPAPVFHEPYAPVEVAATAARAVPAFLEFPEPDEQVSVVQEAPRRIQLSSLPRRDEPVQEVAGEIPVDSHPTSIIPLGLFETGKNNLFLPMDPDPTPSQLAPKLTPSEKVDLEVQSGKPAVSLPLKCEPPASVEVDLPGEEPVVAVELAPTEAEEGEILGEQTMVEEQGEPVPEGEGEPKIQPYRREARKIGRNEKCPCGSGKKYKKCCGK